MTALRQPALIAIEDYGGLDSVVPLPEIGIDLVLAEVCERIEF